MKDDEYPALPDRADEVGEDTASSSWRRVSQYAAVSQRQKQAAQLIRQWIAEDDGYDERIWPLVRAELRLSDA